MHIPILHQDDDIIVVNKPAGIPTHAADPADPYLGDALRIVKAQTGLPYLGMHQRLDAETSGVLLFAARREANAALARAFEGREVRKVYLALVHGTPKQAEGVIDAPIVRERGERYRVTGAGDPRGLVARTRYGVVATTDDRTTDDGRSTSTSRVTRHASRSRFTLLELIPETGRPHQIRVHLAHIGCPVVGDPLYDPQAAPCAAALSACLSTDHPASDDGAAGDIHRARPDIVRASRQPDFPSWKWRLLHDLSGRSPPRRPTHCARCCAWPSSAVRRWPPITRRPSTGWSTAPRTVCPA